VGNTVCISKARCTKILGDFKYDQHSSDVHDLLAPRLPTLFHRAHLGNVWSGFGVPPQIPQSIIVMLDYTGTAEGYKITMTGINALAFV
jgi:hypothetical protein